VAYFERHTAAQKPQEEAMQNSITWFEIPCQDLKRAAKFYEQMLSVELEQTEFMGVPHGIFPASEGALRGALIQDVNRRPSNTGTLVYLNAGGKLDACLERAAKHGGTVEVPRTSIGPQGFVAMVRDTEGNLVGLHTPPE
jgi:uncharacterized protein